MLIGCLIVLGADTLANTKWAALASRKDRMLPPDGLLGWRTPCLDYLIRKCSKCTASKCDDLDIYEFGVYTGRSMRAISKKFVDNDVAFRRMWGFDSFQGLPAEDTQARSSYARMKSALWTEGAFNAADLFNVHTLQELTARLEKYILDSRVGWVPGFYNESLSKQLAQHRRMHPALFVDIDCDLYSSAYQALNWMFENRLMGLGSVVGYDDWAAGGAFGEQRAHREIAAKYNATFRQIPRSLSPQPCFELVSFGHTGEQRNVSREKAGDTTA
tara:strand:- start:43 stop:861 length:819 start_codon:yes stop_codon:yes gene_type:complete